MTLTLHVTLCKAVIFEWYSYLSKCTEKFIIIGWKLQCCIFNFFHEQCSNPIKMLTLNKLSCISSLHCDTRWLKSGKPPKLKNDMRNNCELLWPTELQSSCFIRSIKLLLMLWEYFFKELYEISCIVILFYYKLNTCSRVFKFVGFGFVSFELKSQFFPFCSLKKLTILFIFISFFNESARKFSFSAALAIIISANDSRIKNQPRFVIIKRKTFFFAIFVYQYNKITVK